MKTIIKFAIAIIAIISISIFVTRCKSSTATDKEEVATAIDTFAEESNIVEEVSEDTSNAEEPALAKLAEKATPALIASPLVLVIKNLKSTSAPVVVGLYGVKNKFPDPKGQMKIYKFKPHGKELTAKIRNLKYGQYALAIYQDVNSSGKIDKNFIGIPTEGYAFSNNYKPTIKAPNFDDCKFDYNAKSNTVTMTMIQ